MKHFFLIILAAACIGVSGCNAGGASGSPKPNFSKEGSYALGMNMGTSMISDNIYPDLNEFLRGIKDALNNSPRYSMEEAYQILNDAFEALTEEQNQASIQAETDYLAQNSAKPGVIVTPSGLQYEVIRGGYGPRPTADNMVRVHYEGTLTDGTVFDSSRARGEPMEFHLGGVIPGWTEGIQLMDVGSTYRLIIPSELGYGPQGVGGHIPPYSTLIFEVELIDIVD